MAELIAFVEHHPYWSLAALWIVAVALGGGRR